MNPVSVLLPTLRLDDYFFETLESLLRIDYPNLTIVVIHDFQNDHTDDLRGFEGKAAERKIELKISHPINGGLVSALNYGISIIEDEYICRIDADDLIVSSRIRLQSTFLDANPNVAVVGGQLQFMETNGRITDRKSNYPIGVSETRLRLEDGCFVAHPSVMFRKSVVQSVGGYRPFFRSAEDYDLWLRILQSYDISNLEDVVTFYRQHSGQMSANTKNVDLYTRSALHSHKLRKLKITPDLPSDGESIEAWINGPILGNLWIKAFKSFNNRRISFGNFLILKIKFTKSRGRYGAPLILLPIAMATTPLLVGREIRRFGKKCLKRITSGFFAPK